MARLLKHQPGLRFSWDAWGCMGRAGVSGVGFRREHACRSLLFKSCIWTRRRSRPKWVDTMAGELTVSAQRPWLLSPQQGWFQPLSAKPRTRIMLASLIMVASLIVLYQPQSLKLQAQPCPRNRVASLARARQVRQPGQGAPAGGAHASAAWISG